VVHRLISGGPQTFLAQSATVPVCEILADVSNPGSV